MDDIGAENDQWHTQIEIDMDDVAMVSAKVRLKSDRDDMSLVEDSMTKSKHENVVHWPQDCPFLIQYDGNMPRSDESMDNVDASGARTRRRTIVVPKKQTI